MSDDELRKELMKGYKEKILVLNQDMSSEDLVRYFRFLLSNARRLYTRFLQKKV